MLVLSLKRSIFENHGSVELILTPLIPAPSETRIMQNLSFSKKKEKEDVHSQTLLPSRIS